MIRNQLFCNELNEFFGIIKANLEAIGNALPAQKIEGVCESAGKDNIASDFFSRLTIISKNEIFKPNSGGHD